ncbi:MAG TPA: aminotransferase class I/II-fold pyridoxal phosphate-dependent enzyme [Gemmatimonadales bacterium]|jgi:threonine aldolase
MSLPRAFASDNTAPVHPAVLAAFGQVNVGSAPAYGADQSSDQVRAWFRTQFGNETEAFLVWNGTGANVVALRALTRPWQAVICAEQAHINVDECGAPELLTGCKLIDIPTDDAKLTVEQVRHAVSHVGDQHAVQARVLALTQVTEYGTVYSRDEIAALCTAAHELGLVVFMDGSRIANAAVSLDLPVRAFTSDVGVDALSFGATKNGAMGAEAVVFFHPPDAESAKYLRKQSMQLASKGRYLAAQFLAMAENDLWLANARNANAMAQRLASAVRRIDGVTITQPVQASAVFARLSRRAIEWLQRDYHFYYWNEQELEVRWMTNWATSPEDVDEFAAAIRVALAS